MSNEIVIIFAPIDNDDFIILDDGHPDWNKYSNLPTMECKQLNANMWAWRGKACYLESGKLMLLAQWLNYLSDRKLDTDGKTNADTFTGAQPMSNEIVIIFAPIDNADLIITDDEYGNLPTMECKKLDAEMWAWRGETRDLETGKLMLLAQWANYLSGRLTDTDGKTDADTWFNGESPLQLFTRGYRQLWPAS